MVETLNPRARAWFSWGGFGWTERCYLYPGASDPIYYSELAQYWAQARSRLLGPGIHIERLDVSLRDNYRDSFYAGIVPTPESRGDITYDPAMAQMGSPEPLMIRLQESFHSPDGSHWGFHWLNGWPRTMRTELNRFSPAGPWVDAYNFYKLQLVGDPNQPLYPPGRFGWKSEVKGTPETERHLITSFSWADGYLYLTAPGIGAEDGDLVLIGGLSGGVAFPVGLHFAVALDEDTFAIADAIGGWARPKKLYARRVFYQFQPYTNFRLGKITKLTVRTKWVPWTWENLGPTDVPINPCGMIMAYGRGPPYRCKMRFYHDSDAQNDVQWKIASPTAKVFPEYHSFSSSLHMDRPSKPWSHIGEVEGTRVRALAKPYSDRPGVCFMGTLDQWADGCSIDDPVPPEPDCCKAAAMTAGALLRFSLDFTFTGIPRGLIHGQLGLGLAGVGGPLHGYPSGSLIGKTGLGLTAAHMPTHGYPSQSLTTQIGLGTTPAAVLETSPLPTMYSQDDFNKPDGTEITSYSKPVGPDWVYYPGPTQHVLIYGKLAIPETQFAMPTLSNLSKDLTVGASMDFFTGVPPGNNWQVFYWVRFLNSSNYWAAKFLGNTNMSSVTASLVETVGGVTTTHGTATVTLTPGHRYNVEVVCFGTLLALLIDGVTILETTMGTLLTEDDVGMFSFDTGLTPVFGWDNFFASSWNPLFASFEGGVGIGLGVSSLENQGRLYDLLTGQLGIGLGSEATVVVGYPGHALTGGLGLGLAAAAQIVSSAEGGTLVGAVGLGLTPAGSIGHSGLALVRVWDEFTDSNGVNLISHPQLIGGGWFQDFSFPNPFFIENDSALWPTTKGIVATDTLMPNHSVDVDVVIAPNNQFNHIEGAIVFRYQDSFNYYAAVLTGYGTVNGCQIQLQSWLGGIPAVIQSVTCTVQYGMTHHLNVTVTSTSVSISLDGINRITRGFTGLPTAHMVGLWGYDLYTTGAFSFDNFTSIA